MNEPEPSSPALIWLVLVLTLISLAPISVTGMVYPDKWTLWHTAMAGFTSPWIVLMVVILYVAYKK